MLVSKIRDITQEIIDKLEKEEKFVKIVPMDPYEIKKAIEEGEHLRYELNRMIGQSKIEARYIYITC